MPRVPVAPVDPFRRLQGALMRRRVAELEPRLRVELLAIATLIGGFVFWQARVSFAGIRSSLGSEAVVLAVLALGVVLAATGGALVAARHTRMLTRGAEGPSWLALPIEPARLAAHLAWESRLHSLWVLPFGAGVLVAAFRLIPWWELASLALAGAGLLALAGALGARVAFAWSVRSAAPRPGLSPLVRVLADRPIRPGHEQRRSPTAPALRPWQALLWKDTRLFRRSRVVRRRIPAFLLFGGAAVACWFLPLPLPLRHTLALGMTLVSATALGDCLINLSGEDPFAVLRSLPVGALGVWGSRVAWVAAWPLVMVTGHALAARELTPHARQLFLTWTGGAAFAIALLGANYGITLFPRSDVAQRIYTLALGIAVAASVMIPLLGWIVLLAGVVHSMRRLPHWSRLEDVA